MLLCEHRNSEGRLSFSYVQQCHLIYVCTVTPCGVWKAQGALLKSKRFVTECVFAMMADMQADSHWHSPKDYPSCRLICVQIPRICSFRSEASTLDTLLLGHFNSIWCNSSSSLGYIVVLDRWYSLFYFFQEHNSLNCVQLTLVNQARTNIHYKNLKRGVLMNADFCYFNEQNLRRICSCFGQTIWRCLGVWIRSSLYSYICYDRSVVAQSIFTPHYSTSVRLTRDRYSHVILRESVQK